MRKPICLAITCAFAGFLSITSNASADDFAPPPWRGGPNYTLQGWEFMTPGGAIQVPGGYAEIANDPNIAQHWGNGPVPFFAPIPPFGLSTPDPLATWPDNMQWTGHDGDGGWTAGLGGAEMMLWIPNWIDNEDQKWLRIQLTYAGQPPQIEPIFGGFGNNPNNTVPGVPLGLPTPIDPFHYYQDWEIRPNPDWERIPLFIPQGTTIDEIVIDTISFTIPEPTTATLLVVGITAMTARRRR